MTKLILSISTLFISLSSMAWINISPERRLQLDSLMTYIPTAAKSDLHALHDFIDQKGQNDEEKVWLIYGYFAIHTHYDEKRAFDRKAKFQTPEYTISKRKGVCRDFSFAFKALCDLSNIPCLPVFGRGKMSLLSVLHDLSRFNAPNNRHQWNVVKINQEWQIMDPTWTHADSIFKYYSMDSEGKKQLVAKAKIPDRTYYDAIPQNISRDHKPYHPAYYLMDSIPSFATAFQLDSKRDWIKLHWSSTDYLDSLNAQPYPTLSYLFNDGSEAYSHHSNPVNFKTNLLNYDNRLQDKDYLPSLQDFYCHLEKIKEQANYYYQQTHHWINTAEYIEKINAMYIRKLEEADQKLAQYK